MSGHSKWSQIKRQKGANDAKRGALFTKLTREIIVAARQGGGDVDGNYRLRMAVEKAREASMPAENIRRAVERATGGADADALEEITYEGFGPNNVAVIVQAMTDNRNRTAGEVRSLFNKAGGSLAPVAWQFEQRGVISVPLNGRDPDEVTLAAIDAGAADVGSPEAGEIVVYTEPADLQRVRQALAEAGYPVDSAELSMEPTSTVALSDERAARQTLKFVESLEDLEDVQNVYANFDIPADLMERLEASVA
ncbi:MAG: YebC/PmpR family DNA-binding transcriptional regulator [Chloroflexota bacterium]|nr:YebC/PmpR family DNA-binding transcriptional regulator [Chloroflexota bacterium]